MENKIIMITGATSGFGRAIAIELAKKGANIIATGRRKERLELLTQEIKNDQLLTLNFDVRNQSEVYEKIELLFFLKFHLYLRQYIQKKFQ